MPPTRAAMGLLLVGLAGAFCSCRPPASSPSVQSRVGLISSSPDRRPTVSSAPAPMEPVSDAEIATAERVVRLDSRDIQARIRLADLYIRNGKQPEAARVLRAILRTQPRTVEAYRRLAALYRAAGYPDREYEALRALVRYAPDDWQSAMRLADIAMEQGWFDIATPMLARAARTAPQEPSVFLAQAALNFLRNDWPQMETAARKGLKLAPTNVNLWIVLSDACRLQGRLPEAEQALRTAIAHTTETTAMTRHYARLSHLLLEPGWKPARTAEAEQAARVALQTSPEDVEALYRLARAQDIQGHSVEAEANYFRAAKQDIQFESLPFYLGSLYRRSSDPQKHGEGERLLALHDVVSNNTSEFAHTSQMLRQRLGDPAAHRSMAEWYLKVGRAPQAIMELHRALELNPRDPEARHRLAQTLRAEGRKSEVKQYEP
jgi:tetratricopeptide (TPR) repeat protein